MSARLTRIPTEDAWIKRDHRARHPPRPRLFWRILTRFVTQMERLRRGW